MLNKILKSLNGHSAEPATVAEALAQLGRDRDAVRAEIDNLNQRRRQALLDDATDAELDKIERQIDRATVRLEKLVLSEQPLRDQLTTARAAALNEATARHFRAIEFAYAILRDAVLAAEDAQRAMMAARDAAVAEIGEAAVGRMPAFAFGGLLGMGAAEAWVEGNDRILAASRASGAAGTKPAPAPRVRVSAARFVAPPPPSTQRRVSLDDAGPLNGAPPSTLIARRSADDAAPLAVGEARVRALQNGWSPNNDRPQCYAGQLIRMPADLATAAAERGLVEIVESFSAPATAPNEGEGASAP